MRRHSTRQLLYGLLPVLLLAYASAQDWIKTGTGLGVEKVRIAVPDFKASNQDARNTDLLKTFNDTLWNDLDNAGIFEMVSKSFYPLGPVGAPADVKFDSWSAPPPNAAMLVFGNIAALGNNVTVQGWLYDVKNVASPQVLGKQYTDAATAQGARAIAHKFADEIILRLGGGINGIAETQIFYVSARGGHKEIWAMDYDGANQHALTTLGTISLSPHISPDGSRLAFSSFTGAGWEIQHVLLRPEPAGVFPEAGRDQSFPGVVAGWCEAGILVVALGKARNPRSGPIRWEPAPHHKLGHDQRFTCMEPQDGNGNCLGQPAGRSPADLHHGSGRNQCPAHD